MSQIPEETFLLLEKHKAGDPAAMDSILARYYPRVTRIVGIRLRARATRRADLADLVQQTMIRAIGSLDNFEWREDARLIDWFARIAERVVLSDFRDQRAACRDIDRESDGFVSDDSAISCAYFDPVAQQDSPSTVAARREDHDVLDACLGALTHEQREAILLRDFAGASWETVAAELERPSADAARKFYERARQALKEQLQLVRGEDMDEPRTPQPDR